MISGSPSVTTCWQNEWDSGVCRHDAHGSGSPCWLLKNWRSRSTSETRATGTFSRTVASRVSRSKDFSEGESSRPACISAASRTGSSIDPPAAASDEAIVLHRGP